jgi:hypothetical protein
MSDILNLHHLVRCLEIEYCSSSSPRLDYGYFNGWQDTQHTPPPEPSALATADYIEDDWEWRERFDSAAYTALLLGAVLARPYSIPFIGGTDSSAQYRLLADQADYANTPFEADKRL